MDEAGIDDTDTEIDAWGLKGQRIYGMKKGAKKQRVSIASALSQGKLIAPFMLESVSAILCKQQIMINTIL